MGDIVRKNKIALFLDTDTTGSSPAFKRIKKSTTLTLTANPNIEDYDYISDASPSSELISYNYSIDQDLVMINGEDDYEFIFNKFFNLAVGESAHVTAMIVFMQESETTGEVTTYKAWSVNTIISINDLAAVDQKINFNIKFNGDITIGTAVMALGVPTFTADSEIEIEIDDAD